MIAGLHGGSGGILLREAWRRTSRCGGAGDEDRGEAGDERRGKPRRKKPRRRKLCHVNR